MSKGTIIIIEDCAKTVALYQKVLSDAGYEVVRQRILGESTKTALKENIETLKPDCLLVDLNLGLGGGPQDGLDIIPFVKSLDSSLKVLAITGEFTRNIDVACLRQGADDFIEKGPRLFEFLVHRIDQAVSRRLTEQKLQVYLGKEAMAAGGLQIGEARVMLGTTKNMQEVFASINEIADLEFPVLITGESGTGKELVAWGLHYLSKRQNSPLVPVNCAAIPDSLLEAELFGSVKGAFTGAGENKPGFFEATGDGTLFLDEIGESSERVQCTLLRVLESRTFMKVGSSEPVRSRARIVAATNADPVQALRPDLYHRLSFFSIHIPPLREHLEDIPMLVERFVDEERTSNPIGAKEIQPETIEAYQRYHWPGNVRELRKEACRAMYIKSYRFDPQRPQEHSAQIQGSLRERLKATEQSMIAEAVRGSKTLAEAAEKLNISRSSLHRKLQENDLHPNQQ